MTWLDCAGSVLDLEIKGLENVRANLGSGFVEALGILAGVKGRVVVSGIGKSGLVGRKIAATLSSTGTPAFFLHPVEGAHGDLGMIRQEDVCLALSNSGETDELNNLLPSLKRLGVRIVAITGGMDSRLARIADAVINSHVSKEACPFDLVPTASTTAALALGDALAVCLLKWNSFNANDFKRVHPGGSLGKRLAGEITELMHKVNLPVITAGSSMDKALAVLNSSGLGTVIIVNADRRVMGILTDGDLRRIVCSGELQLDEPVDKFMTVEPTMARLGQTSACVLDLMEKKEITVLPVVDDQSGLQGVVHLHDLLGKGALSFSSD